MDSIPWRRGTATRLRDCRVHNEETSIVALWMALARWQTLPWQTLSGRLCALRPRNSYNQPHHPPPRKPPRGKTSETLPRYPVRTPLICFLLFLTIPHNAIDANKLRSIQVQYQS